MATKGKILIVEDNKSVASALEILLLGSYVDVEAIHNPNQIYSLPNLAEVDVILLDMNFTAGVQTGNEGLFWLQEIKKKVPEMIVVMLTAYGDVELAVTALKRGATDFILKPWSNEKLLATIKNAYNLRKSNKEIQRLKANETRLKEVNKSDYEPIIGNSKAVREILKMVQKVAQTDINILITGENGTGKELIAKEIHRQSNRHDEVFVKVDIGSLSESLFESELFGHIKGAFTDAKEDRIGKFEAASGGTLFLDEIGNLPLSLQAKILSAIQNRAIVRVGSNKIIPIDIRLICATNADLQKQVQEGTFREDLLYRINTIQLEQPALRERDGDISILSNHFLNLFSQKYNKSALKLSQKSLEKLEHYSWPGNIRELRHTLERAVILSDGKVIGPELFSLSNSAVSAVDYENKTLSEMEQHMIQSAIDQNQGNLSAAAEQLGVTRQTLYNKIKKNQKK